VVDKELIDALRFPTRARASVAISLYLHRGKVALGSAAVTIGGLLAWLLI
jgi:predicted HTH domain antitoxin